MKKLILPAILLVGMASCNKPAPAVDTVGEQNKSLVQKYDEAIVTGDTSNLESFLAEKFMAYGPAMKDSSSRQQIVDIWKKNWRTTWASIKFDRDAILAFTIPPGEKHPGDWVADWAVITVNQKNGLPTVKFRWHTVFRVKDGKIDQSVGFYDLNDILVQQGFTITPPAPKKAAKTNEIKKKVVKKKATKKK